MPQKGREEISRESNYIDDIIQKAHIEKELLNNLTGVSTVFDGGAGSGRFSVFLAKQGIKVTHFDISDSMLETARKYAEKEGVLENIDFVKGRLGDLSAFSDNSFDMVISIDSPISYTYPNHKDVMKNLIRISKNKVLFSVYSRLGSLPQMLNPMSKMQYILDKDSSDPLVKWYINHSKEAMDNFDVDISRISEAYKAGLIGKAEDTKIAYLDGKTPWPVSYLFMPDELINIMEGNGLVNVKIAGPGAFSRSIPNEILVRIMNDKVYRKEFLDFCYEFDKQPSVAGLAKDNLVATGSKHN